MTPFPKYLLFSALTAALALCAPISSAEGAAADLAAGSAKGSLNFENSTVALTHAAAFVDQKDERKPVILLLSDKKLPAKKWKSEFDMMFDETRFNGIVFFLDTAGKVFRTDVHVKGKQTGVSGLFELRLDNPASKELTGSATVAGGRSEKLEVAFHATLE